VHAHVAEESRRDGEIGVRSAMVSEQVSRAAQG
jgi:hypothetical protein